MGPMIGSGLFHHCYPKVSRLLGRKVRWPYDFWWTSFESYHIANPTALQICFSWPSLVSWLLPWVSLPFFLVWDLFSHHYRHHSHHDQLHHPSHPRPPGRTWHGVGRAALVESWSCSRNREPRCSRFWIRPGLLNRQNVHACNISQRYDDHWDIWFSRNCR